MIFKQKGIIIHILVFIGILIFSSQYSIADETSSSNMIISIGGGNGGDAKAASYSFDIGVISPTKDYLFSFGVGVIQNGGNVPNGILRYPVPHSSYTNLGFRQDGSEYVLLGKMGVNVNKTGLYLIGMLGASSSTEIQLAQSNVTGWFYEQSSTQKTQIAYGGGLAYVFNSLLIETDYDNRKGYTGMIGMVF